LNEDFFRATFLLFHVFALQDKRYVALSTPESDKTMTSEQESTRQQEGEEELAV